MPSLDVLECIAAQAFSCIKILQMNASGQTAYAHVKVASL